ncbi:hypothetical protein R6Q59_023250 [Mikania micrantha]
MGTYTLLFQAIMAPYAHVIIHFILFIPKNCVLQRHEKFEYYHADLHVNASEIMTINNGYIALFTHFGSPYPCMKNKTFYELCRSNDTRFKVHLNLELDSVL